MSDYQKAMSVGIGALMAGALLLVGPTPATAQEMDARWLPWMGCWQPAESTTEGGLLCIQPIAGDVGVEMITIAGGEIVSRETVRADGVLRETTREDCQGAERAEFSDDGRRIYLQGEFLCEGQPLSKASGLIAMSNPYEWLDVKSIEVDGESIPWVQRYRLASAQTAADAGFGDIASDRAMSVRSARVVASRSISVDDVIEASAKVDDKAIEAWVIEREERFDLDADELIRLDDAGIPENIIDVMVAVSYPSRFVVDREAEMTERVPERYADRPMPNRWGAFGWGGFYDPFYYGPYSRYGLYYSPFGYGYRPGWGYYGGWGYGYRPVYFVTDRHDIPSGGRMVRGQGYTRGSGSSGSARTATGRSSGGSGVSTRTGASGSSGSVGRSSGSTGRTARRRGGGG